MNFSKLQKLSLIIGTIGLMGLSTSAHAFADDDARRAILDLRSELRQSQQARIDLQNQLQDLQNQMASLRGNFENLNNTVRQVQQQQASTASKNDSAADVQTPQQVGDPNEQQSFDSALDLFRQGNYAGSSKALHDFVQAYPNSPLAPSAMFYEGSSRYANKDFQGAIAGLQSMVSRFPKDSKAGDALLVIAGSQVELNNIPGAKATLQRIVQSYPDSPASDTAKSRLSLIK